MTTYPNLSGKRVLVTGATAGIGQATALGFVEHGAEEVIITGRRQDRLDELAKRWNDEHPTTVVPVAFDVTDRQAIEALADERPHLFEPDILVNNAGLARGVDPVHEAKVQDWEEMIDTNVKGLLYMTRKVTPAMAERGSGHVVNLGSTAGRWVYPGGTVYCATKHAVRALTEGTRMDLHGTGVRVTNIEPGIVETEFSEVRFKGDQARAAEVYEDTRPLYAEDIADSILWACSRPDHVDIQEVVIFPTDQASVRMIHRQG